jgi:hypothetical protein
MNYPVQWWNFVEARWGASISMRYPNLDRKAQYRLRVTYVSRGAGGPKVRLVANGNIEIHPYREKQVQPEVLEFDVPREATSTGDLRLVWSGEPDVGGAGVGPMIAEVFLIRKD